MSFRSLLPAKHRALRLSLWGTATIALVMVVVIIGGVSCQKPEETSKTAETAVVQPHEFSGKVKVAWGKYLYLPAAQGFDIIVEGNLDSGTLTDLVDKEIRVRGNMMEQEPSLFVADSIEVKEGENQWRPIFTRTSEVQLVDFFHPAERDSYQALTITNINKPEDWEGKGKGKVFGQLRGAEGTTPSTIIIFDAKGKELGKIIVDRITDYALYYTKKLRLYDKFWFYLHIKETVERPVRLKNRELFHADVVFAGLY